MRSTTAVLAGAILIAWAARAQEPESRPVESRPLAGDELVASVEEDFKNSQNAFFKEYRNAKTDEEKDKLYKEKYPRPSAWFPRLYAAAKAEPKSKNAEKALIWIATHGAREAEVSESLEIIRRDHIESPDITKLADSLVYYESQKADEFLQALESQNPHREVKGRAAYARAARKKNAAASAQRVQEAKGEKEIHELEEDYPPEELARLRTVDHKKTLKDVEEMLVRIQKEYADVDAGYGGTLGDRATGDLFEMRNLAVGKAAPDIEGEGIDGKPLKLSDFKGKVVVLDFWGNW